MPDSSADPNLTAFDASQLRRALLDLQAESAVGEVHVLSATSSTNDEASFLARSMAKNKSVVFAESQSAGRGRRGNQWSAPPGRDLLFSLLLYPDLTKSSLAQRSMRLPHLVAVAIARTFDQILPEIVSQLKWPNDIYVKGKKVAGILIESSSISNRSHYIIGVGINVNSLNSERPAELQSTASSLREECQHSVDRHQIAAAFLANFDQLYPRALQDFSAVSKELHQRSLLIGHEITATLEAEKITGKVIGFADNGEMILELSSAHGTQQRIIHSADQVRMR